MAKHILFLALGSNLGDKKKNICGAYAEIEKRIGRIVSKSAFYITEPEGFNSENLFLNSVCEVESGMDVREVIVSAGEIENEMGRLSKSHGGIYSDRTIDIDILLYDNLIIDEPGFAIPHPRLHLRDFVLNPLAEIAPEVIHPVLMKNIETLKKERERTKK